MTCPCSVHFQTRTNVAALTDGLDRQAQVTQCKHRALDLRKPVLMRKMIRAALDRIPNGTYEQLVPGLDPTLVPEVPVMCPHATQSYTLPPLRTRVFRCPAWHRLFYDSRFKIPKGRKRLGWEPRTGRSLRRKIPEGVARTARTMEVLRISADS